MVVYSVLLFSSSGGGVWWLAGGGVVGGRLVGWQVGVVCGVVGSG